MRVALLLVLALPVQAAPVVATVSDLKGTVERRPGPLGDWQPAQLDEGVALRDAMQTRQRSAAELTFVDGTVLALGEQTRLAISVVLFDPEQAPPEIRVSLREGEADVRVATAPLIVELGDGRTERLAPGTRTRLRMRRGVFETLDAVPLPNDGAPVDSLGPRPGPTRLVPLLGPSGAGPDAPPGGDVAGVIDPARPLPDDLAGPETRLEIRVRVRGTP